MFLQYFELGFFVIQHSFLNCEVNKFQEFCHKQINIADISFDSLSLGNSENVVHRSFGYFSDVDFYFFGVDLVMAVLEADRRVDGE
jgi:hypothetical protein